MSRTPASFKITDLERAATTLRKVGLPIVRTEVGKDGRFIFVHSENSAPVSPLDEWKAKRNARATEGD